jgi:peptidyl-prolyl cis-trans isomerase A (cyclophilin A)
VRLGAALFVATTTSVVAQETPPPPVPAIPSATTTTALPPPPPVQPRADATVTDAKPATPPPPGPGEVRVRIATADGAIVVDLDRAHAPLTTANFLKYVDQHRFDGTTFYRADKVGPPGLGLIQGGVRGDPRRILPPVAHEPTAKTGLAHVEGTISMARLAPGSARGDFFITTGPLSSLDAHPQAAGDNAGFAAFGHVVAGMDVVHRILDAPVSDAGEGAMRGQLLAKPVKIITVRRGG